MSKERGVVPIKAVVQRFRKVHIGDVGFKNKGGPVSNINIYTPGRILLYGSLDKFE